ncbi:MAG: hypothetical protein ACOC9B_01315 [Chloroflexota bacterium]
MQEVILQPTLEECIETTARKEYRQVTESLLGGAPIDEVTTGRLQLLQAFLKTADLPALRAASERELLLGKNIRFRISGTASQFNCRMEEG